MEQHRKHNSNEDEGKLTDQKFIYSVRREALNQIYTVRNVGLVVK